MGPTASGKSALALALAERFPVEIVSVDSAQVYRGMDIGTAKPDAATRARVPHHLVDIIEPTDAYSAARFRADALAAVAAIRARGRLPLLVGGTMLYFKALHEGLSALPPADPALRAALDARAAAEGWPALHAELARSIRSPRRGSRRSDAQRIQRALEVHALTGTPLSALQGARASRRRAGRRTSRSRCCRPTARSCTRRSPSASTRCWRRASSPSCARCARAIALQPELPSMRCVGYRQAWQFLDGAIDAAGLRATGIAATRQLAKRQFTWLRAIAGRTLRPHAAGHSSAARAARIDAALSGLG